MEDIIAKWRWARIFVWVCGAIVVYFSYGYFTTHDAGVGATLLSLGGVWFFYQWYRNIEAREAVELHIWAVRENNRPSWRR
jgi:hypothetical protein